MFTKKTNMIIAMGLVLGGFAGHRPARADDDAAPDLFTAIAAQGVENQDAHVIASQAVAVDLDRLSTLTAGDAVGLNTIVGPTMAGTVGRVDVRDLDQFTIVGRIDDTTMGYFIIVVEQDVAVGIIDAPTSGGQFKLGVGPDGVQHIRRIDNSRFPPDEIVHGAPAPGVDKSDVAPPVGPLPDGHGSDPAIDAPPGIETSACAPIQPVFDVLIIYTHLARMAAGGTNAIQAEALLAIETANVGYEHSEVNARMRLVGAREWAYNESGGFPDHLDRLQDPDDGWMDGIHDWRNAWGADFVSLFVTEDGSCGLGRCTSDSGTAFSVVNWDCAVSNFSFHHEIGHNQGCLHNRGDSDCDGAYSYSYGWRFFGDSGDGWRTVMAYNNDDGDYTRINWFSNPDVIFDGRPTGAPIGGRSPAHNARTIINRAATVEGFRTSRFDVWVDFAYGGAERGSFSQPFDTVAEGQDFVFVGVGASEIPNLWIKAGSTGETLTLDKEMYVRACGGTATIGQ